MLVVWIQLLQLAFTITLFTCPAEEANKYKYSCNIAQGLKYAFHNKVSPASTRISSFLIISDINTCTGIRNLCVLPLHGWRYAAIDHAAYCSMWVALLLHNSIHNTSFDLRICVCFHIPGLV